MTNGFQRKKVLILTYAMLALLLLSSTGLFGTMNGAAEHVATVQEKEDMEYDVTIEEGEKAKFKWDILNPTNATYHITVLVMSDNTDFTGKVDKTSFQVFAGQTDTVTLTVKGDLEDTDKVKYTLAFELKDLETNETVTAYKSATVKIVVTHGISFHGYFVLNPEAIPYVGLEDNNWTRLLMIILLYLFFAVLTLLILNPLVKFFVRKTKTEIDDVILQIIAKPIFVLVILYGLLDAVALMDFIPADLANVLDTFFGLGVLLIVVYLVFKLFKGVLIQFGKEFAAKTETELDDILIPVVEKIGLVFIAIFGLMGILSYFGINLTMAAAGFGVFGLVIAFAAQSSIANFFGGIFILLDRPFKVDDLVLVGDKYCRVLRIGLRSTRVYSITEHALIIMPNDKLANSTVVNLSAPDQAFKVTVKFDLAYGSVDPEEFTERILEVVRKAPEEICIVKDKEDRGIWGRLNALKDSSIEFIVGFWVTDIMKQWSAAGYVRTELYKICMKESIEIPFPQLDVHLKDKT